MRLHGIGIVLCAVLAASAAAGATLPYTQTFEGTNGAAWPSPWFAGTPHVVTWDLQSGRGRLDGDDGYVARMILPGYSETDVEVLVTFEFENVAGQGIGLYVRQNGGTLQEYLPHGQGYAMFLKGSWAWPEDLGIWREIDGIETQFATGYDPVAGGLLDGTRYRLRYRVVQETPATTRLQARVWPEAGAEPAAWTVDVTDAQAQLQNTAGSFAIDIYNHFGGAHVFIDDLSITPFPIPVAVQRLVAPATRLALGAVRPHPVAGEATFELDLPRDARVEVTLVDVAGRVVARVFDAPLPAGRHTLAWNADQHDLAPGLYLLVARAGAERSSRRFIVRP